MDAQLVEFAKRKIASGETPDAVIAHLRGQKWEEGVIAEVMAAAGGTPAPAAAQPRPRKRRVWPVVVVLALALSAGAAVISGYFVWRHYAAAKVVREKLKYVEMSGRVIGNLEVSQPAGAAQTPPAEFALLDLRGLVDSSQADSPRAAFTVALDPQGALAAALAQVPPSTDARFTGATLLTVTAAGRMFGGIEATLVDRMAYLRFSNMPFSKGGQQNTVAALASALIGPNVLSGAWLRMPLETAPSGAIVPHEQQFTWALLLRPTEKVFGQSRELQFVGKSAGEPINGEATQIHHYKIDGAWLTKQLTDTLRESKTSERMMMLAQLQTALVGGTAIDSSDTLNISDGEMDVWVGKADTLPRRIVIRISTSEGTNSPLRVRLQGELALSYGKPVAIAAPEPSISLEQLQQQLNALQGLGNFF